MGLLGIGGFAFRDQALWCAGFRVLGVEVCPEFRV